MISASVGNSIATASVWLDIVTVCVHVTVLPISISSCSSVISVVTISVGITSVIGSMTGSVVGSMTGSVVGSMTGSVVVSLSDCPLSFELFSP